MPAPSAVQPGCVQRPVVLRGLRSRPAHRAPPRPQHPPPSSSSPRRRRASSTSCSRRVICRARSCLITPPLKGPACRRCPVPRTTSSRARTASGAVWTTSVPVRGHHHPAVQRQPHGRGARCWRTSSPPRRSGPPAPMPVVDPLASVPDFTQNRTGEIPASGIFAISHRAPAPAPAARTPPPGPVSCPHARAGAGPCAPLRQSSSTFPDECPEHHCLARMSI